MRRVGEVCQGKSVSRKICLEAQNKQAWFAGGIC
jgi:hypothetical protein